MIDPETESKAEFTFSTAPPCPSFFFPYHPEQQIKEKDEQDEQDNAPQSP